MAEPIMNKKLLGNEIIRVLKTIYDPEIPVDVYELGLIYDVQIHDDYSVDILMTLTTPNCPVAESMPQEIEDKIAGIHDVTKANVDITFEPAWTKDMLSEEAMLELGML